MKFSIIKEVKTFCEGLHSEPCFREVVENLESGVDDFEVGYVRFIKDSQILSIMADEIFSDDYRLGCFNASFIAKNSNLNIELVVACQQAEAFAAIGKALNATLSDDEKESFCEADASADGYGHHFNSTAEEQRFNGVLYHVFDNRN